MSIDVTSNNRFVLGIDVGGGSLKLQLFKVIGGSIAAKPTWETSQKTNLGVAEHASQIADLIILANDEVKKMAGTLTGIGIGAPGRFDASSDKPAISPGTSPHMGKTGPNEFDGVNLKGIYEAELAKGGINIAPIFVANDGNAMLAGQLEAINTKRISGLLDHNGKELVATDLRNQFVGLFGIGTGVGHAIAKVDGKGGFTFATDGHASKLRVPFDDKDWERILAAKVKMENASGKTEMIVFPDKRAIRGEDLMRAPVINALADIDSPDKAERDIALGIAGKYMARLAAIIRKGDESVVDEHPQYGWSAADKQLAAQTSIYLIGGGIMPKQIGKEYVEHAGEELRRLGLSDDIRFVRYTGENQAARAAATLVPASVYQGFSQKK